MTEQKDYSCIWYKSNGQYNDKGMVYMTNPTSCGSCDGNNQECDQFQSELEIILKVQEAKKIIITKRNK